MIEEPTQNERGEEGHPAFGLIGASRVSISPPGVVLFDSDVRHQHTIRIRIKRAVRKREVNRDWIFGREEIVEVELSEAQWASLVSTMNSGDGVSCSIRHVGMVGTPQIPYDPRLARTMAETEQAAHRAFDDIKGAFRDLEALINNKAPMRGPGGQREALNILKARINNAVPNVDYAGKTLIEQTEDVVNKARADIEAYVINKAHQLQIDPADLDAAPLPIGPGNTTRLDTDPGAE